MGSACLMHTQLTTKGKMQTVMRTENMHGDKYNQQPHMSAESSSIHPFIDMDVALADCPANVQETGS